MAVGFPKIICNPNLHIIFTQQWVVLDNLMPITQSITLIREVPRNKIPLGWGPAIGQGPKVIAKGLVIKDARLRVNGVPPEKKCLHPLQN